MGDIDNKKLREEKDLGVIIDTELSFMPNAQQYLTKQIVLLV